MGILQRERVVEIFALVALGVSWYYERYYY